MEQQDFEPLNDFEQNKKDARDWTQGKSLLELVQKQSELSALKDELEGQLKEINAWYDIIRQEAVPQKMENEGIEKITFDNIGRISITADVLVSIKGGCKEDMYAWLRHNQLGDLIQPTVNAGTLKAYIKKCIKDGKPYPTDYLNVTLFQRASITKV